jgi:DNA-directed RNA polymerase subunit RPC12/RpoP
MSERCPTCGTELQTTAKHVVTERDQAWSPLRVDCGWCGRNVLVKDGRLNVHGPRDDHCIGSGDEVR